MFGLPLEPTPYALVDPLTLEARRVAANNLPALLDCIDGTADITHATL